MKLLLKVKKLVLKPFKEKTTKVEEMNSFKDANSIHLSSNVNQSYIKNSSVEPYSNIQNTTSCSHCKRSFTMNTSDHNDYSIKRCSIHNQCECSSDREVKPTLILRSSRSEGAIQLYPENNQSFKSVRNIYKEPNLSQSASSLSTFDLNQNNNNNYNNNYNNNIDMNIIDYYYYPPPNPPNHLFHKSNYYNYKNKRKRRYSSYLPSSIYPSSYPFLNTLSIPSFSPPFPHPTPSSSQQIPHHLKKKVSFSDTLYEIKQYSTSSSLSSLNAISHNDNTRLYNSSNIIKTDTPYQYPIQKSPSFHHPHLRDHQLHYNQPLPIINNNNNNNNNNSNNNMRVNYSKSVPSTLPFYLITNKPNEYIPKSVDMNTKKVSKYLSTKKFRDKKQWNDEEEQNKMNQVYNHHQFSDIIPHDASYIVQQFNQCQKKGKVKQNYNFLNLS